MNTHPLRLPVARPSAEALPFDPQGDPLAAPLTGDAGVSVGRHVQDAYLWTAFRYHSRTFSLATRLLRREVRLPIATVYLYCRTVDTVADHCAVTEGVECARHALDRLEKSLEATFAGRPPGGLLWQRLAEVDRIFGLLQAPFYELLDGARWDLDARPIPDTAALLAYANLVAGSVGAMVLPFLVGQRSEIAALEGPARALGNAMQVTNILRDVGEDWHRLGRIYLPADAMARHGVTPDTLTRAVPTPSYQALLEETMALAERLFDEADTGIRALPSATQQGIRAAARMYREILNEVRASGYDNLRRRGVVPLGRKLRRIVYDGYARRRRLIAAARSAS